MSPIGQLDPDVRLVESVRPWGKPALVSVRIPKSSLASQAVGPVTSDLETAFGARSETFIGRRFQDVARKLLSAAAIPLGQQLVAKDDSVLGALSAAPANGIYGRYEKMVRDAFDERWWNVPGYVVDVSGRKPVLKKQSAPKGPNQLTVMEYNFTLFFGLAVQEYERTLIADDTPFDRFMAGEDDALSPLEKQGLEVFLDKGKCVNCHGGPELTNASLRNVQNEPIERMLMGDDRVAVYDNGFYNIGVRPTLEDIGVGGRIGPRNLPLSNSRLFQRDLAELVSLLRAWNPRIPRDKAIRLANKALGIPRIPARPDEAEKLLDKAAPKVAAELAAARDAIASAIAKLPPWQQYQARVRLAPIVALLRLLPDPVDPGPDPEHPYGPPLRPDERVAVDGAFKTPACETCRRRLRTSTTADRPRASRSSSSTTAEATSRR